MKTLVTLLLLVVDAPGEALAAEPAGPETDPALWAQRLVGGDLAAAAAEEAPETKPIGVGIAAPSFHPERFTPAARYAPSGDEAPDRDGGQLGDKLANLLFDNAAFGASVGLAGRARLTVAVPVGRSRSAAGLAAAAQRLAAGGVDVALFAVDPGDDDAVARAFDALAARGALLVLPSGDAYPRPVSDNTANAKAIRVAGLGDTGYLDIGSQEDAEIDLAAPGAPDLGTSLHRDGARHESEVNGSAAAAALVTACVALVARLLPGVTLEEIRSLLVHTAMPTPNRLESRHRNGAGTLDAYRAVKVALRLRALGWPDARAMLVDGTTSLFDFAFEAGRLDAEAAEATDAVARLHLRRKAFLLCPDAPRRAAWLAEATSHSLTREAAVLVTMDDPAVWTRRLLTSPRLEDELAGIRAAGNLGNADAIRSVLEKWVPEAMLHRQGPARLRVLVAIASMARDEVLLIDFGRATAPMFLELASLAGRRDLVLKLLEHFPLPPAALDIAPAASSGSLEIVRSLLARGASVNGVSKDGITPLMAAARAPGNAAVIALLVRHGADVNRVADSGESALTVALAHHDGEATAALLAGQASLEIGRWRGMSPLQVAQRRRDPATLALLCRHGAEEACASAGGRLAAGTSAGSTFSN